MTIEFAQIIAAVLGGIFGGTVGVFGSYWGPKWLEQWRETKDEEKRHGPRKKLLKAMLDDTTYKDGRYLETLCRVSGTTPDECRRLLIELNARGVKLDRGEGWVLLERKPIGSEQ